MKKTPDPVATAVETLAAPRWEREADWHTFKEKLVEAPKQRFQFARRRPYLFAAITTALLCAGAAAVVEVYQRVHFTGVATLNDGTVVEVEGELELRPDAVWVTAQGTARSSGQGTGQMQFVTDDGRTVNLVVESVENDEKPKDGALVEKKEEKAPVAPK